ncbi:MAG: hypothetical protein LPK45_11575 [Bacteroidota bacterium]|nr:hypothetical protein [Bacteroidota bacterium]MDX5431746.1 hypothetical protein [Bacteroidota bacterium]MDX5470461.1 hypothetical protein [Bacteroidota bacterium]
MNAALIHLSLTHFPVIGFVLFTPLFLYAIWKKKQDLFRIVSMMIIVLSISAIVVFNSGEGAEEIIEATTDIGHDVIHEHEEAGEITFWLTSICGLAAALVLALRMNVNNIKHGSLLFILFSLLLATSVSALYTAHMGGKIRHPEMNQVVDQPVDQDEADDD